MAGMRQGELKPQTEPHTADSPVATTALAPLKFTAQEQTPTY